MSALLSSSWSDTQVGIADSDEIVVVERIRPNGVTVRAKAGAFVLHLTEAKAIELRDKLTTRLELLGTGQIDSASTQAKAA